jgi:cysteine desulfurase family protein (TIGR01976 family)
MMPTYSDALPDAIRPHFPGLQRLHNGGPLLFADGPGGTQVPDTVIAAIADYLSTSNANIGGHFATSRDTVALVSSTRTAVANFLNAPSANDIVFGQNMTSLTFAMSRAIARTWQAGDEIIVTNLDHDANVAPWMQAAEDRGVVVKTLPFTMPDLSLSVSDLSALLSPRTRLVALTAAANAVGTKPDLAPLIAAAHAVGALVYIDAVHYAPHDVIDVRALDCDFLACSAYKFGGPHLGILYGRTELLESLSAYKVRTSSPVAPGKWETGTQNFAGLAGLRACLASLGGLGSATNDDPFSRAAMIAGMTRITAHERELCRHFLSGIAEIPGLHLYGISDPARLGERTPTFGLTLASCSPQQASQRLATQGICVWDGHFYAKGVIDQLGLADQGGLIRIGFAQYTTHDEVERVVQAVADC